MAAVRPTRPTAEGEALTTGQKCAYAGHALHDYWEKARVQYQRSGRYRACASGNELVIGQLPQRGGLNIECAPSFAGERKRARASMMLPISTLHLPASFL